MFFAINSKTNEKVNSLTLEENPSYPFIKEEIWYADPDEIENHPKEKDIKKIEVRFRIGALDVENWNKTKYDISPHFFIPNRKKLKINIIPESKEHKLAKNWIYNKLKQEKLLINYSKVNKPYSYENQINLFDLMINKEKIGIETNCTYFGGIKSRIADVICPFQKIHPLFNTGIVFEIQFSKMMGRTKTDREMDWALKGYSVVWLFVEDFEEISDSNIALKKDSVNGDSNLSLLKSYIKNLKRTFKVEIQEEVRKLMLAQNNFKEECDKIKSKTELLYREKEKQINEFLEYKLKNLSENFQEEITNKIQKNFFKNNEEEIEEVIHKKVSYFLRDDKLKELEKELINKIDFDILMSKIKNEIYANMGNKIKAIAVYKQLIENPPRCPGCGALRILKKGEFWGCPNYKVCEAKTESLPPKIKELLKKELW